MCEGNGQKDGDMLENGGPLHRALHRSNLHSKPTLQVKRVMPLGLFLIHRQSTKNAFWYKLTMPKLR